MFLILASYLLLRRFGTPFVAVESMSRPEIDINTVKLMPPKYFTLEGPLSIIKIRYFAFVYLPALRFVRRNRFGN